MSSVSTPSPDGLALDGLTTPSILAAHAGTTVHAVYQAVRRGVLPVVKIGPASFIPAPAARAWLVKREGKR